MDRWVLSMSSFLPNVAPLLKVMEGMGQKGQKPIPSESIGYGIALAMEIHRIMLMTAFTIRMYLATGSEAGMRDNETLRKSQNK